MQPGAPSELMVVNTGDAPIKQGVLLDEFAVIPIVVEEEIQCIGNSHCNSWREALKRGYVETMRLPAEIWEAPHDRSCVPKQWVSRDGDAICGSRAFSRYKETNIAHSPSATNSTWVSHGIAVCTWVCNWGWKGWNGWNRSCCSYFRGSCGYVRCRGLCKSGCCSCICFVLGGPGGLIGMDCGRVVAFNVFFSFSNSEDPPEIGFRTLKCGGSGVGGSGLGRWAQNSCLHGSGRRLLVPRGLSSVTPSSFPVEWFADRVRGDG